MAVANFKLPSGRLEVSVIIAGGDPVRAGVREISAVGGVIELDLKVKRHDYVDCTLTLAGEQVHLFAHVVDLEGTHVKLRWLHFDPGEQETLAGRLAKAFQTVQAGAAEADSFALRSSDERSADKPQTRRVIRPQTKPVARPGVPAAADSGEGRPQTRQVVRPRKPGTVVTPATAPEAGAPAAPEPEITAAPEDDEDDLAPSASATEPSADSGTALQGKGGKGGKGGEAAPAAPEPVKGAGEAPELTSNWRQAPAAVGAPAQEPPSGEVGEESKHRNIAIVTTDKFSRIKEKPPGDETMRLARGAAEDGDVRARILKNTRTVSASELAARHEKVRVLNISTIRQLIRESVEDAMADLSRNVEGEEQEQLMAEVESRVEEALKSFRAEKADMAARGEKLQAQLEEARKQLEAERKRKIDANRFTVSEGGMIDLQQRFDRILGAAIRANGVNDELAGELQKMVTHVLDAERQKIADQARASQQDAIALLEKKVQRLAQNLDETSKERDRQRRRLAMLEAQGVAVGNIMDVGIDEEDPDAERKRELMKEIVEQNRKMREEYKAAHDGQLPAMRKRPQLSAEAAAILEDAQDEAAEAAEAAGSGDDPESPAAASSESPAAAGGVQHPVDEAGLPTVAEGDPASADIDPDDLPWEGPPPVSDDQERAVKRISVADVAPPALEIRRGDDVAEKEPGAEAGSDAAEADPTSPEGDQAQAGAEDPDEAVNPDDLPWQPPADDAADGASGDDQGPVKKIAGYQNFEPPPLERSSGD